MVQCLEDLVPMERREAVHRILRELPPTLIDGMPPLIRWIKEFCGPGREENLALAPQMRKVLRDLLGALTYRDFQRLVDKLLTQYQGIWPDPELNQIKRRCAFWSNYQDSFLDLRILLPPKAREDLDLEDLDPNSVAFLDESDIRPGDRTQSTEICIFEGSSYIIIEFFRGRGSETAILPATPATREFLFREEALTVKRIRRHIAATTGEKLDHTVLWQGIHEERLRHLGIIPSIRGNFQWDLPGGWWPYEHGKGIKTNANPEKIADRERALLGWKRVMQQLYEEARLAK